ncbi:MAG: polysaccharide pyruvyl transferase family protein [Sphaerochaetaceae bacterium]|nr:polysaccharide pyruvyl transferase family protein [Sphaerochaetaceae bacterium]
MRILVTGQCTLHWGRLENGNIGNYYIVETTFRELHRVFPNAEIVTTFQMTDEFQKREEVTSLPMELFYSWSEDDLEKALLEFGIAQLFNKTGKLVHRTPYIDEVMKSHLVVDFSGEMWGYHADLVGKDRFLVGLLKDNVPQLLGKPTVMLAGTQGRFPDPQIKEFAKVVFKSFDLVANREAETEKLLIADGFDVSNLKNFACPAFLFEPAKDGYMDAIYQAEQLNNRSKPAIGFVLCGFNMLEGPFDKWPRKDAEYDPFVDVVEYIIKELNAQVVLMSHSNGFELPPNFKLKHGRDYPIAKQLREIVRKRGKVASEDIRCIDNVYNPWETKAIIGKFDMFVTGRLHASVAAISQSVPTVVMMHGHGQESHKTIGFFRIAQLEDYVVHPSDPEKMKTTIRKCWEHRDSIREHLDRRIPEVQSLSRAAFDEIRKIVL